MKKLLSLVVLGGMLLAACGGGPGSGAVAATVDGTEITVGDVNSLMDFEGTVPVQDFAQFLGNSIQFEILFTAAEEDFGITVTEQEIEEEADRLIEQSLGEGQSREDFLAQNGLTERYVSQAAKQNLIGTQIREQFVEEAEQPTAEELETALAEARIAQTEACVSHILVEDEAAAEDVMERLDSGEEFADVAAEVSTDTGSAESGGDLGCGSPAQYVEPFRDAVLEAPIGEVIPPVESQFGFHIIRVSELTEPAPEDLPGEEELASSLIGQSVETRLQEWYTGALEAAEVTVEEEYGTWTAVPPTVTPPSTGTTGAGTGSTTTTTGE